MKLTQNVHPTIDWILIDRYVVLLTAAPKQMSCNKFFCSDWCAIHAADSELSYGALQRLFRADCTDYSVLTLLA